MIESIADVEISEAIGTLWIIPDRNEVLCEPEAISNANGATERLPPDGVEDVAREQAELYSAVCVKRDALREDAEQQVVRERRPGRVEQLARRQPFEDDVHRVCGGACLALAAAPRAPPVRLEHRPRKYCTSSEISGATGDQEHRSVPRPRDGRRGGCPTTPTRSCTCVNMSFG